MIELKNVSFCYHRQEAAAVPQIKNITVSIETGSFTVIVGKNGSGKSTLAKLMSALLVPSEGTVTVDGLSATDKEAVPAIREKVGMIFQNPDNQSIAAIVEQDIAFGPENLGLSPEEIIRRVDEALKTVSMEQYRTHDARLLSGGQKQRIAIAGILALFPSYIVCDESTSMLDPVGRAEIIKTLCRLHTKEGKTIALITHNMDEVLHADRVLVMQDGRIVADDSPPCGLFMQPELIRQAGLKLPQTAELAASLRAQGFSVPATALTIETLAAAL